MGKFKKLTLATAISSAFVLTGCGGSSGGSSDAVDNNDTGDTSTTAETGVFVDAAVAGINYTTSPGGQSGQTNELGEYNYEAGDTVVFSIGGIDLPAVEATGRITPADMGSGTTDWSSDQTVVNILRLLQTLDSDDDASNGITITEDVHTALQDIDLDPSVSETDFETQANTAINTTGKTLIAKVDAVNHFQSSQSGDLVGSWVFEESNGNVNVLTFLNDSEYLIAHSKDDTTGGTQTAASAEYGEYTWSADTGAFTVTVGAEFNGDGDGGLELVPVGKAYFGFTDEELREIDRFVRKNTINRFGPVREVAHGLQEGLVLEVAFEGLNRSGRHKSGVAMRFPRISRLRWDKPAAEADRLETLEAMLPE